MLSVLAGILLWLAVIVGTVKIAAAKNRSPVAWGIFAFFLPVIALVVVALLGPARPAPPPVA